MKDPLESINAVWSEYVEDAAASECFDRVLVDNCRPYSAKLHDASRCTAVFIVEVKRSLCSLAGTMYGGAAASIFDMATTLALAPLVRDATEDSPPFWQFFGVSRTLNCTYFKPVLAGKTVAVVCDIASIGKRLCTLRGEMREFDPETKTIKDDILVLCEHGKANTDPPWTAESSKL